MRILGDKQESETVEDLIRYVGEALLSRGYELPSDELKITLTKIAELIDEKFDVLEQRMSDHEDHLNRE